MEGWAPPRRTWPRTGVTDLDRDCFGDQYMWGAGVPLIYRALAAPGGDTTILAAPKPTDQYTNYHEALKHACAYWGALMHLLVYSFGWTRPERGLLTWLDAGHPEEEDPRLQLVAASYWRDQQLRPLIEWLLISPTAPQGVWRDLGRRRETSEPRDDLSPELRRTLSSLPWPPRTILSPQPGQGGSDPLHLSCHLGDGLADTEDRATLCVVERKRRSAVFIHPSMTGWYSELCRRGDALQDHGASWRIDVYIRTVGFIGTYRRSRRTNIWFSGRHRHHDWGNS